MEEVNLTPALEEDLQLSTEVLEQILKEEAEKRNEAEKYLRFLQSHNTQDSAEQQQQAREKQAKQIKISEDLQKLVTKLIENGTAISTMISGMLNYVCQVVNSENNNNAEEHYMCLVRLVSYTSQFNTTRVDMLEDLDNFLKKNQIVEEPTLIKEYVLHLDGLVDQLFKVQRHVSQKIVDKKLIYSEFDKLSTFNIKNI